MKIAIDARSISHPQHGGFKTYTKNLVKSMVEIADENHYILYLDRPSKEVPSSSNVEVRVLSSSLPGLQMPLREQIWLRSRLRKDQPVLAHFPCATGPLYYKGPFVVTVHDVIEYFKPGPERDSSELNPKRQLMHLYNRFVQVRVARNAKAVITVSECSKNDISKWLGIPLDRIFVTYEGHGLDCRLPERNKARDLVARDFGLFKDYVLAIGSADHRKNVCTLLEAFARLNTTLGQDYELVIVWTHSHLRDNVALIAAKLGLAGRVRFLEEVPDHSLAALFSAATVFVFPSLYEGFGLPPLEAMACGTPVIASNRSSIPEVVGDAAIKVDPEDAEALASAISKVMRDPSLQGVLAQKGLNRASLFTWRRCAVETLRVYKEVAEKASQRWKWPSN